jgi:CRISPR-associated RAMP protein (TIGR02581 family)
MTINHHFEKISNRYHLKGVIEVCTALHVGSGRSQGEIDSVVIKQGDKPFIPGSSLRGVIRSTVERIVNSLGLPITSCLLFSQSGPGSGCPTVNVDAAREIQNLFRDHEEQDAFDRLFNPNMQEAGALCATCRLFGSTFYASKLKITDLPLAKNSAPLLKTRDGVGIDRDRGAAVEGIKFNYEVVEKTQRFDLEIIGENLDDQDLGLLAVPLLEMMDEHFWLGGNTSRGIGKIRLLADDTLQLGSFSDTNGLRAYLKAHGKNDKGEDKKWLALKPQKGAVVRAKIEGWLDALLSDKGGKGDA